MKLRFVGGERLEERPIADLQELMEAGDGFLWLDIPEMDAEAERLAREIFDFDPRAIRDCKERSHIPKVFPHKGYLFMAMHSLTPGPAGHLHLLEIDMFIGQRYLVTVHGPYGRGVPTEVGLAEADAVLSRLADRSFQPARPAELAHALLAAIVRHLELLLHDLADEVATMDRRMRDGETGDAQLFLDEMFIVRHELMSVTNRAWQSREACASAKSATASLGPAASLFDDLEHRFERLRSLADGEKEFLQGVLDFYQSRTATAMNIAMERLALIAAVSLPVTAIASVYGMNVIVNSQTDAKHVVLIVALMLAMSGLMLRFAKKQGWW